jgi:cytidylate kinase
MSDIRLTARVGDILVPNFDLSVWVDAPTAVRIERLRMREHARFREGGDMCAEHYRMY